MDSKVTIALGQIAPKMGDVEYNFRKILSWIDRAKEDKADIIAFPELATCGYLSQGLFLEAPERSGPYFKEILERSEGIHVVLGSVEETDTGLLYNSAIVVKDGKIIEGYATGLKQPSYRKCYLPTYGMFEEHRWFAPGGRVPIFKFQIPSVGEAKAGILICEDLWHPLPSRIAAFRGAKFVIAIAASPKTFRKPNVVEALVKARAIENTIYLIFVNAAGGQDMVNFWGGSMIASPEGDIITKARLNEEDYIIGDIDLYRLKKIRQLNPMLRDERIEMVEDFARAFKEARDL